MKWWDIFRFAEECGRGLEETEGDQETASQRRSLEELLENLALCWRDGVAAAYGAPDLIVNTDWQQLFAQVAPCPRRAIKALQHLRATARRLRPPFNAHPQLALELLAAAMVSEGRQ